MIRHAAVCSPVSFTGVVAVKRILLLVWIVLLILLKLFFPPGHEEKRQAISFLGLEREAVQTLGRGSGGEKH